MPEVEILYWQDEDGFAPVVDWLEELGRKDRQGLAKCAERIGRLATGTEAKIGGSGRAS